MGMVKVTAPAGSRFTGKVAGISFADGVALVDPEVCPAGALGYFGRRGYAIEDQSPASDQAEPHGPPGTYDPHAEGEGVTDVLAYLARGDVDETEAARVLDAESAGAKPRKGITDHRAEILADKRQAALDADTPGGDE